MFKILKVGRKEIARLCSRSRKGGQNGEFKNIKTRMDA